MHFILHILIGTLAVLTGAYILPGVHVKDFTTALVVAVALGFLNAFVKPVLILLTLPITLLTLGLFIFVINALLILLVSYLVPGFDVNHFGWALLFGLIVSIVSSFLHTIIPSR